MLHDIEFVRKTCSCIIEIRESTGVMWLQKLQMRSKRPMISCPYFIYKYLKIEK
jgi:hypothetical protein